MTRFGTFFGFVFLVAVFPIQAHALLPPDLLFSVGSSVVQFFSIGAVVVGGVFSSIVFTGRRWFALSSGWAWLIVGIIFLLVVSAIAVVYVLELKDQAVQYRENISLLESANENFEKQLRLSVPLADYQNLLTLLSQNPSALMPVINISTTSVVGFERQFISDNIVLYSTESDEPLVLEIDFNRIEKSAGIHTHYTFMNGLVGDSTISDYDSVLSTTTKLQPNRFVKTIERLSEADGSTRDQYKGVVSVNGDLLSFFISGLKGDFITRNRPTYTQYQSVGEAKVTYKGKTFEAEALVEGAYSMDYSKEMFFPGYDTIDSTTYQFVLWDESDNFYMIDVSDVRSNTPEYPSHVWLLHKNEEGDFVRKSFEATINAEFDGEGRIYWKVTTPEFDNATLQLTPVTPFKQNSEDRIRAAVEGTITDDKGKRTIGGILHLVE